MEWIARPNVRAASYALASLGVAFLAAVLVVAGATRWFPEGSAGIDHIMVPIILFPVVWIVLALFLCGTRKRTRAWAAVGALGLIHVVLVAYGFVT